MKVGLISLGCSKNQIDSEFMLGQLKAGGHTTVADPAAADVLIVNTCGFIQSAKEEAIQSILEMAGYKTEGKILIVTGCLTERYPNEMAEGFPEVDAVLGTCQYGSINQVIARVQQGERIVWTGDKETLLEGDRELISPHWYAYVKVGEGCDNRCAYCAIPQIRGGWRSRKTENVLEEIRRLADRGVKEVVLSAQDTTRFGTDTGEGDLAELVAKACEIDGIEWVRALYLYPDAVTDKLLDALEHPKACPYLDIPIQHTEDGVLKAMNRRSTRRVIEDLMERARKRSTPFTLRTTVMVGFPGETEQQYKDMLRFLKDHPFDRLGCFAFSPEEGTKAAEMPDPVDAAVAEARRDELMRMQEKLSAKLLAGRVGQTVDVLVEGNTRGRAYGRSRWEAPEVDGCIRLNGPAEPGTFQKAEITAAASYDLMAKVRGD